MDIIKAVYDAKVEKNKENLGTSRLMRRVIKLSEEVGEVAEAALGVTADDGENYKEKTYDDLREEIVDTLIVGMDLVLSIFPDEEDMTYEQIIENRSKIFERKIDKWLQKKKKKK